MKDVRKLREGGGNENTFEPTPIFKFMNGKASKQERALTRAAPILILDASQRRRSEGGAKEERWHFYDFDRLLLVFHPVGLILSGNIINLLFGGVVLAAPRAGLTAVTQG